ncbi:sensor histidine kinase [Arcanobacterium hippocoleae]|uniref:sensor histidine kinase n=1 Tax=Arcanobacterium hippocoleae TaxID=149017 RepID=UPI0033403BB3
MEYLPWIIVVLFIASTGISLYLLCLSRKHAAKLAAELAENEFRPAIISHEIRTPITLISAAAELLNDGLAGELNPQQRNFIQTISENSAQVINIAENFLINVKLTNSQALSPESVDLQQIVTQTARELRHTTTTPINVESTNGIGKIQADPQLLRQLIWNLINNCTRHAGENAQVNVRVTTNTSNSALIVISDDGAGIAPEEYANIWKPFTTGTARRPGTGIGMMVAKQIVAAHGGSIMLDSIPGKGTAFHVLLPLNQTPVRKRQ